MKFFMTGFSQIFEAGLCKSLHKMQFQLLPSCKTFAMSLFTAAFSHIAGFPLFHFGTK
jgi:hypothetical protein